MAMVTNQKTLHTLFQISVWTKGIAGVLETLTGVLCLVVTPKLLTTFVVLITAPEISEDPDDWIATTLSRAAQQVSVDTTMFAAAYLILHGLIKIILVASLLKRRFWAYPLSIGLLAVFIAYQCYRYTHTHSILLVLLTVFDLAVIFLIWREYQTRRPDSPKPFIGIDHIA